MVVEGHDRAMPDIRMDVEPSAAVTPETGEPLRSHIIPRQGKRHGETLAVQRPEQLTAIGVIIGAPDQRAATQLRWTVRLPPPPANCSSQKDSCRRRRCCEA